MKIHNKRELQQIATNHLADIDYKDFMKTYIRCTSEPYSFLTIDATLPANNSLRFGKNLLHLKDFVIIKITLTDELKILDDTIKANQAQYDLDRKQLKFLHYHLKLG